MLIDEDTAENWNRLFTGETVTIEGIEWIKGEYGDYVEITCTQE